MHNIVPVMLVVLLAVMTAVEKAMVVSKYKDKRKIN